MARSLAVSGARQLPRITSDEEAIALLERLVACANYSFTPSGKQIMISLTPEELRAKLG